MMRLEVLNDKNQILAVHRFDRQLILLGRSPGAHVHIGGKGVGALHVAIKPGVKPIVMDLGGPTPLRVNGKETLECELDFTKEAILEIGSQRVRLTRKRASFADIRTQPWIPVTDGATSGPPILRARLYLNGQPQDAINSRKTILLPERFGLADTFRVAWIKRGDILAQLPAEWLSLGGRIQIGRDHIAKLEEWKEPVKLEPNKMYRVTAGPYTLELLASNGALVLGTPRPVLLPADLRKPIAASTAIVAAVFALWLILFGRPQAKVEEPYTVYARIQNIPVEQLPEPESQPAQAEMLQAGGGSGSESTETTAPTVGAAASVPTSRLAASLTGGLKNLVGNVLSGVKNSNVVVADSGVGQAAAGAPGPSLGRLAAVGQGSAGLAGATKLGKLAIAGSGKGFSGGAGIGLGAGLGSGVGSGVGAGIGRGGFRMVEEESIVDGGLDKSVIAAVIQNNLAQIKYCYERQLVADPDLFGKVVATWVINAAGTVDTAAVKQTTLNSPQVEQCMLAKISGWKFPQPKNGTKVNVVYPFLFKSTK